MHYLVVAGVFVHIYLLYFCSLYIVCPSAIVTVYDHKDKVKDMLQGCPNPSAVTVFLTEVPKDTILLSNSE